MSITHASRASEDFGNEIALYDLTLPSVRLAVAKSLVIFSFIWPYFNYALVDPDSMVELNFLPVFLAALLLPEVTAREKWSILLALPVFGTALIWAGPSAPLRLAIGIIPLHFVLNLTRSLRVRGQDILPPNLAYRALQAFVGFSVAQTVDFYLFPIIPAWLSTALITILPRYSGIPYDEFGIRGVQGWASEPSGAAVTCISFALLAILQRPDRRWRVLGLYAILASVNKSVYALLLLVMLSVACLAALRRKRYALVAFPPVGLVLIFLIAQSSRLADLHANLLAGGMSVESNSELARFAQIFYPLSQFPRIYQPPTLFGSIVMEPMGLLPLLAGYGSVFGLVWIAYILWRNFPVRRMHLRPFAWVAGSVLFMMVPPDLIPAVVAFAAFMVPKQPHAEPAAAIPER